MIFWVMWQDACCRHLEDEDGGSMAILNAGILLHHYVVW